MSRQQESYSFHDETLAPARDSWSCGLCLLIRPDKLNLPRESRVPSLANRTSRGGFPSPLLARAMRVSGEVPDLPAAGNPSARKDLWVISVARSIACLHT